MPQQPAQIQVIGQAVPQVMPTEPMQQTMAMEESSEDEHPPMPDKLEEIAAVPLPVMAPGTPTPGLPPNSMAPTMLPQQPFQHSLPGIVIS